ncbi:MAG: imidazole glycerol phosphate synthase subunit HisH [Pseudomonadota bacterium]
MKTVAVIDYGMGNLHSVAKAVESLDRDVRVVITSDASTILGADRIIFPGVGAIRDCMAEIRRLGVDEIVREAIQSRPVLAICVGMQALMDSSEENGHVDCMGVFHGQVKRFGGSGELQDSEGNRLKVPHMGWNTVSQREHPLWEGIEDGSRFYFVHSYYVEPEDDAEVYGVTEYGQSFAVAMARENLFAVQFHPEKSQHAGLRLLGNFLRWRG